MFDARPDQCRCLHYREDHIDSGRYTACCGDTCDCAGFEQCSRDRLLLLQSGPALFIAGLVLIFLAMALHSTFIGLAAFAAMVGGVLATLIPKPIRRVALSYLIKKRDPYA